MSYTQILYHIVLRTAFTYSFNEKDRITAYIKNQQEHHRDENTEEAMKRLFKEHGFRDDSTP